MDKRTKFNLERFPTSESAKRQLSYVSDGFYDESYIGKWLYQVIGIEYDEARKFIGELPNQFFPETATWGLRYHEEKWGLPVREDLSVNDRRRAIYQKRGARLSMTPYRMEQLIRDITGLEVFVADAHDAGAYGWKPIHPNCFKVFFKSGGMLDTKQVRDLLNKWKQSHTTYEINDRFSFEVKNEKFPEVEVDRISFLSAIISAVAVKAEAAFRAGIGEQETIDNLGIIYKTQDSLLFDGKVKFDGVKRFDSQYRKEVIE